MRNTYHYTTMYSHGCSENEDPRKQKPKTQNEDPKVRIPPKKTPSFPLFNMILSGFLAGNSQLRF